MVAKDFSIPISQEKNNSKMKKNSQNKLTVKGLSTTELASYIIARLQQNNKLKHNRTISTTKHKHACSYNKLRAASYSKLRAATINYVQLQ